MKDIDADQRTHSFKDLAKDMASLLFAETRSSYTLLKSPSLIIFGNYIETFISLDDLNQFQQISMIQLPQSFALILK